MTRLCRVTNLAQSAGTFLGLAPKSGVSSTGQPGRSGYLGAVMSSTLSCVRLIIAADPYSALAEVQILL